MLLVVCQLSRDFIGYDDPNDQTQPTFEITPGFKPFTGIKCLKEIVPFPKLFRNFIFTFSLKENKPQKRNVLPRIYISSVYIL